MLTSEEIGEVTTGWILRHSKYQGLWVVSHRESETICMVEVNGDGLQVLSDFVDSPSLSKCKFEECQCLKST